MALLKYFRFSRGLFLILNACCQAQWDHRGSTVPPKRYPLTLHPIPTPRIGLHAAQVARYVMESRDKRAIAKLSSSEASISRKVQSGGGSWNTRKYCESSWSAVNTKCSQVAHCSLGKLEVDHRLDKGSRISTGSRPAPKAQNFTNTNVNYPYTNREISTAKCLIFSKIAKFSSTNSFHYTVVYTIL